MNFSLITSISLPVLLHNRYRHPQILFNLFIIPIVFLPCHPDLTSIIPVSVLQLQYKVHQPGHVRQGSGRLGVPLGVGDYVVTPNMTRVASTHLQML